MIYNQNATEELKKDVRAIGAHVAQHRGTTLVNTYTHSGAIKSFEVQRTGAGRFFGYGICARLNIKLVDIAREIDIQAGDALTITYDANNSAVTPYPDFTVTEVNRDENTNALSVTAYDGLYFAQARTVDELQAVTPYTMGQYAAYIAAVLGLDIELDTAAAALWALSYADGANLDGTETLREVLDDIAEASGTVYAIQRRATGGGTMADTLAFRRLRGLGRAMGKNLWQGEATEAFTTNKQILLDPPIPAGTYTISARTVTSGANGLAFAFYDAGGAGFTSKPLYANATAATVTLSRPAAKILLYSNGWNLSASNGVQARAEYIQIEQGETATAYEPYRDYYEVDRAAYFTASIKTNRRLAAIASVTELGDNITAELKESGTTEYLRDNVFLDLRTDRAAILQTLLDALGGQTIAQYSTDWRGNYLLEPCDPVGIIAKDGTTARGYFLEDTATYTGAYNQRTAWNYEETDETESNPATLGEVLNVTRARVDKANREITITAAQGSATAQDVAALYLNTNSISASVEQVQKEQEQANATTAEALADLRAQVNATMTAEQVQLTVAQEIAQGTTKVQTETGYTFDASGLRIARTGSDVETAVTDDGLHIYRAGSEVLRADNEGVKAEDLHATTYLIIGTNSRLEDYEKDGEQFTACFWIGQTSI